MNLTPNEVLIIAVVALIVLGPQRLPEAARQIGKGYRELRKMSTSVRAELDSALKEPVEAIKNPIDEITTSFSETMRGEQATPATPSNPQEASDAAASPPPPNSSYRPADELDPDPTPDLQPESPEAP